MQTRLLCGAVTQSSDVDSLWKLVYFVERSPRRLPWIRYANSSTLWSGHPDVCRGFAMQTHLLCGAVTQTSVVDSLYKPIYFVDRSPRRLPWIRYANSSTFWSGHSDVCRGFAMQTHLLCGAVTQTSAVDSLCKLIYFVERSPRRLPWIRYANSSTLWSGHPDVCRGFAMQTHLLCGAVTQTSAVDSLCKLIYFVERSPRRLSWIRYANSSTLWSGHTDICRGFAMQTHLLCGAVTQTSAVDSLCKLIYFVERSPRRLSWIRYANASTLWSGHSDVCRGFAMQTHLLCGAVTQTSAVDSLCKLIYFVKRSPRRLPWIRYANSSTFWSGHTDVCRGFAMQTRLLCGAVTQTSAVDSLCKLVYFVERSHRRLPWIRYANSPTL